MKTEYAICNDCGKRMAPGNSCTLTHVIDNHGNVIPRIPYGENGEECSICPDCNVKGSQVHHFGCDMERCPVCHEQIIGCGHVHSVTNKIG